MPERAARGAILLVGGRSTRMGSAKAALDWHGVPLVEHVARLLARAVPGGPVVVVRADPAQALPPLPAGVRVVEDAPGADGPLAGLAAGLAALAEEAVAAFAWAVDAPLLHPALATAVLRELEADAGADAVVPVALGHRQPLAAAYRTRLAPAAAALAAAGERTPVALAAAGRLVLLPEAALRADPLLARVDPELASLRNANTPDEYAAALAEPAPLVELRAGAAAPRAVRARRAGDVGATTVRPAGGGELAAGPRLPLVAGDVVVGGLSKGDRHLAITTATATSVSCAPEGYQKGTGTR